MLPDISHDVPGDGGLGCAGHQRAAHPPQAIGQIGRRRRFWLWAAIGTLVMIVVAAVWAFSEYHNAGGWPVHGFSQSSWPPIPDARDDWIIWPAVVGVLATAGYAWFVSGRKPVSESKVKREMERQAGQRR